MTNKLLSFENTEIAFSSKSTKALRKMNFLFSLMGASELTKVGTFFVKTLLRLNFPIKKIIKSTLFQQFCGGETLEECQIAVNQLNELGIGSVLDFSAEGEGKEEDFDKNLEEISASLRFASQHPSLQFGVFKVSSVGSVNLIEKIQQGKLNLSNLEIEKFDRIKIRINELCKLAHQLQLKLLIDAEESWIQETIDELALNMMEHYNTGRPTIYTTVQMYRKDGLERLNKFYHLSKHKGFIVAVKLVRGAYLEKENLKAKLNLYETPINPSKSATDKAFDEALSFCVEHKVPICVGSHNEESLLKLTELMKLNGIQKKDEMVFFAQLYGMSDPISVNLSYAGYNVVKYLPYGPLKLVMPYLFRRAQENASVMGQIGRELKLIRSELRRREAL